MTRQELRGQIEGRALEARRSGQYIDIDWGLPSVTIHRGADDEFHYQEHEASELFDRYRDTVEMTGASMKDVLLASAQEW